MGEVVEISKEDFFQEATTLGISEDKINTLWSSLEDKKKSPSSTSFSKWMFYFGALIIILAMSWLAAEGWERFGGGGIFLIASGYAFLLTWLGASLWKKEDLKIPAGLLITAAVCMVPLAIYGLETYLKIFPSGSPESYKSFFDVINSNWIIMEIGTIIAGLIALRFFPFPFLSAPIFFVLWLLFLDLSPLLLGNDANWESKQWLSLCFGLAIAWIGYLLDRIKSRDYAFWAYFFGVLTFWISLTSLSLDRGEFFQAIYFVINLFLMIVSILLQRKVFMVVGALGSFFYLSHLAYEVFENSFLFAFVLSLLGLLIIYLGILYQRNRESIEKKVKSAIPGWVKRLLP